MKSMTKGFVATIIALTFTTAVQAAPVINTNDLIDLKQPVSQAKEKPKGIIIRW